MEINYFEKGIEDARNNLDIVIDPKWNEDEYSDYVSGFMEVVIWEKM